MKNANENKNANANEKRIGYSIWKESECRIHKDADYTASADLLFNLIENEIKPLFFAIEINDEFKKKFIEVVENIKSYMMEEYNDLLNIEEEYAPEVYKEVKSVKPFIDNLKKSLAISVEKISSTTTLNDSKFQIALRLPNRESAILLLSHLKEAKEFASGVFQGQICPIQDPQNPSILKFPGHTEQDQSFMDFPDQKMGMKLFNLLPELSKKLEAKSFSTPQVRIDVSVFEDKLTKNRTTHNIPILEHLLGYERILLVHKLPSEDKMSHGTLYVQVNKNFKNIFLKSTGMENAERLDSNACVAVKKAISIEEIKINFNALAEGKHQDIFPNQATFNTIRSYCRTPSALTLKKGTGLYHGVYGENLIPTNQALDAHVFRMAALTADLEVARKNDNAAIANLNELLIEYEVAQKHWELAVDEMKKREAEHKHLETTIQENQTKLKSLDIDIKFNTGWGFFTKPFYSLYSKDKTAEIETKIKKTKEQYQEIERNLQTLDKGLLDSNAALIKARSSVSRTLSEKIQISQQIEWREEEKLRTLSDYVKSQDKIKAASSRTTPPETESPSLN